MLGKPSAKMQARFLSYSLQTICKKGGTKMMIPISDLAAEMQKNLDALDDANLFRKAFGNMQEALKYIKVTWYYLDSMVIKMKTHAEVTALKDAGIINQDDWELYSKTYEKNQKDILETMKINNKNQCVNCNEIYPIKVNNVGDCSATEGTHEPMHDF